MNKIGVHALTFIGDIENAMLKIACQRLTTDWLRRNGITPP